ncbi:MAG: ABC transporter substrate-binding protein [Elusimicrobiota bacterium]
MLTLTLLIVLAAGPAATQTGTLRVCDDVIDPITLDPLQEFSEKNHTIIQQIFDGLVRFDPEGRIEPALAVSWRRLDPTTVEFKLRQGVRFHNGEPMDAEAVRFSLERFSDPKGGFPGAGFLGSIDKIEVVDAGTVLVRTKFPDGILLHRLAGLVTVLPPRYFARKGAVEFGQHPVGTGAFKFVEWDKNDRRIVLTANEDYWLEGFPKLKKLVFRFIPAERQVETLLKGELDLVTELPGTATLAIVKSAVARVIKKDSFYTAASSLNAHSGPLADVRVRRALNYAVDKDLLIRYDLLGNGKTIATLSMEGETGHDPALKPYPYDLAMAKRLLREAGYAKGFRLNALVKVQVMRTMNIIASQLAQVGVEVDISSTTDAVAFSDMAKKDWDWVFAGCPDPMSHSFFVQSIFLSSLSPFSVTKDPGYDERLGKMVSALDPEEQQRRGRELDAYIHDQALSLFTYQRVKTYAARNDVDFVPWVTGMPYFYSARRLEAPDAR